MPPVMPCPHTHTLISTPLAPAASQDFYPSSTVYNHTTPTIWGQRNHYTTYTVPMTLLLLLPSLFFDLMATRELRDACTHLP